MASSRPTGFHALRAPAALLGALLLAIANAGPACGPIQGIQFLEPASEMLHTAGTAVAVTGRTGPGFDPATTRFSVDGVDLVAALGLTPPFTDATGDVLIGATLVSVSGFSYDPSGPGEIPFAFTLDGLPVGTHQLEAFSEKLATGAPTTKTRDLRVVGGFEEKLATTTSAGLVGGSVATGSAGVLANQSLGQAVAAPPAALAGGGTLRSGHVEAVEERISAGGP